MSAKGSKPTTVYLRLPNEHRTPVGTIAFQLDGTTMRVGFSLQNPTDKWDRARGREIANQRLEHRRLPETAFKAPIYTEASRYFEFDVRTLGETVPREGLDTYDYLRWIERHLHTCAPLKRFPVFQKLRRRIVEMLARPRVSSPEAYLG